MIYAIGDRTALDALYEKCKTDLLCSKNVIPFKYPTNLSGVAMDNIKWEAEKNNIKELNKSLLSGLRNHVTNYAIYTKKDKDNWRLRYIGQTKIELARSRLTNHLISKDANTGAKLKLVRESVNDGLKLGLKLAHVEPTALRHYIEENILKEVTDGRLDWNEKLKKS